jgi:hypothetical protein
MKRRQVDPKNDAEKFKKPYQERNNHTTVDYGTPIDKLRHPEKNGTHESAPNSGTFDTGKNPQTREPGPIDKLNRHPIRLSSPEHEQHPEKINVIPIAAGVRTKSEIENHEKKRRGGIISQPEAHIGVKSHKSETSQSIGARRQSNPTTVRDAVEVVGAARAQIDKQLRSDEIDGISSSPKSRDSAEWGVGNKSLDDAKALKK